MKVYAENSFARYEHLPMHHRKMYWTDYLKRLVEFALHDPDMSSLKHDRILAEISRVTRVSRSMIQSLENGEVENLPGRTYEIGYITKEKSKVNLINKLKW